MGSEPRPEQDRNSSLKEVRNHDVKEVKTRKTDSWAYENTGDPEAGERCSCLLFTWTLTSFVTRHYPVKMITIILAMVLLGVLRVLQHVHSDAGQL